MESTVENLWSQVLERLQLQLSRPTFETWIKTASAEELQDDCLVIHTPVSYTHLTLPTIYSV